MLFLPWQQTSRGAGRVIAYHPSERPQTVEAPVYGRVARWGENIVEGALVTKGQLILEIDDNDAERAFRLNQQVTATEQKLSFAVEKVKSYFSQIEEYRQSRTLINESYQQLLAVAEQKIRAAEADLSAAKTAEWQLELDHQRQSTLAKEGIVGNLKAQEAQTKYEQAFAKRQAAENYVAASKSDLKAKQAEGEAKAREATTKIQEAEAKHQQAQGEEALSRKELAEIQGKMAQFGRRQVTAPRDGILYRILVSDNAQMLKEGDPLFTIVPETSEQAVELWINGNDVPLVRAQREVRLQFEGWPAVQFAGWPSVAVGTFGGEVIAIDATDDGKGKFRVLVRPTAQHPWPDEQFLRQGARANGWILLNEVSLGYELWRQLNGFPPVISTDEPKSASGDKEKQKVKLPK
ncbi:HlyD family secretion protein [Anatilimnocola sp. NA78]|uniref:HlyD family secretion protein n=1 Tax=Anatilimnocola sp. NA78 TaxID=3415683 RepID=UPI003CE55B03